METARSVFDERGSRWALIWILGLSVMLGLTLIALVVSIAYGVPAWPESTYAYGYALSAPNYITWPLFIAVPTCRSVALTKWAFVFMTLQVIADIVVFVLQVTGAITGLINLHFTTTLFGLIISVLHLILSGLVFFALLDLVIKFAQRPLATLPDEEGSYSKERLFALRSSISNLRWLLGYGILLGAFAWIAFGISLGYGIPAWPPNNGTVMYGWVLSILNQVTVFLYVTVFSLRNVPLTKVTFWISVAQMVINLIVFLVQLASGIAGDLNLNTDKTLYTSIICAILFVLSVEVFFNLLDFIIKFDFLLPLTLTRVPSSAPLSRYMLPRRL